MRLIIPIFFTFIVLFGCSNITEGSNSPKDALMQIHGNDNNAPEQIEIIKTVEVSANRVLTVYKGLREDKEDVFIANIEKEDNDGWYVTNATNIGLPSRDRLNQSSSTEKFQAGYKEKKTESADNLVIVGLDNSDLEIWIEVF